LAPHRQVLCGWRVVVRVNLQDRRERCLSNLLKIVRTFEAPRRLTSSLSAWSDAAAAKSHSSSSTTTSLVGDGTM
jgi:hypothetical protein